MVGVAGSISSAAEGVAGTVTGTISRAADPLTRIHGAELAARIENETAHYRAIMRSSFKWRRFVLNPNKNAGWSGKLVYWDGIAAVALLYTMLLSPFEAGFLEAKYGRDAFTDPWFIANRCIDLIFLCDMILQFFLAYQSVDTIGATVWVEDQRKIMIHYLTTWFVLDATTIFLPGTVDMTLAFTPVRPDASGNGFEAVGDLSALRTMRIIRLSKLCVLVGPERRPLRA